MKKAAKNTETSIKDDRQTSKPVGQDERAAAKKGKLQAQTDYANQEESDVPDYDTDEELDAYKTAYAETIQKLRTLAAMEDVVGDDEEEFEVEVTAKKGKADKEQVDAEAWGFAEAYASDIGFAHGYGNTIEKHVQEEPELYVKPAVIKDHKKASSRYDKGYLAGEAAAKENIGHKTSSVEKPDSYILAQRDQVCINNNGSRVTITDEDGKTIFECDANDISIKDVMPTVASVEQKYPFELPYECLNDMPTPTVIFAMIAVAEQQVFELTFDAGDHSRTRRQLRELESQQFILIIDHNDEVWTLVKSEAQKNERISLSAQGDYVIPEATKAEDDIDDDRR